MTYDNTSGSGVRNLRKYADRMKQERDEALSRLAQYEGDDGDGWDSTPEFEGSDETRELYEMQQRMQPGVDATPYSAANLADRISKMTDNNEILELIRNQS